MFIEIQAVVGYADLCTGSLVTPSLVLTAGHCLDESVGTPIRSIIVFAGASSAVSEQHAQSVDLPHLPLPRSDQRHHLQRDRVHPRS